MPLVEISANSSHICGRKGPETPPKRPFHGCCIATKTFENLTNLTTTNATLMKLTTIMYLYKIFNLAKDWCVKRRKPKTSQNEPDNRFFGSISGVFKNKTENITCLMHYVALHHWSNFHTYLTTFQWVTSK